MLKHTRVGTVPDMNRIGAALARPGMDTRRWISLAVVTKVNVDANHGPFVDIMLMPSGDPETARVASWYAGNGFGAHTMPVVDDEVIVIAPEGSNDAGLVVVGRLWSKADPPPAAAVAHPDDVIVVAKAGQNIRIVADETCNVFIGDVDATHAVARGDLLQAVLNEVIDAFSRHVHLSAAIGTPTGPVIEAAVPPPHVPPWVPLAPIVVASSPSTDLSPNVKVK